MKYEEVTLKELYTMVKKLEGKISYLCDGDHMIVKVDSNKR